MNIRRLLPGLVLSSIALVGCTGPDDDATPAPAETAEATPSTEISSAPEPSPGTDGSQAPTASPTQPASTPAEQPSDTYNTEVKQSDGFPSLGEVTLLPTQVRVAHHAGYDRVVVEFDGTGTPGYRAQYVDEALHPGSGEPIEAPGSHAMEVIITGTRMPEADEDFAKGDYPSGDATNVKGVTFSPPFEGQSLMVIGVDGEQPFTVQTLADPSRLVIDIQTD